MEVRKPNYFLEVDTSSLGKVLGETLIKIEKVIKKESPNAIVILGDTNSSISAIIAKRLHIPIYHLEAGNRSFDFNVPEEINRRIIDHIADYNLVYTENSRRHLLSEGLPHRRIYLMGSPMKEVLSHYSKKITNSNILKNLSLKSKKYFLVSMHREENVDNPNILISAIAILNKLVDTYSLPVIVSTHPRTKSKINNINKKIDDKISFLKPFGFFDYCNLQLNSFCTISDSGTISEESAILNFPAITLRNSMERPEALDSGSIILTGFNQKDVLESIRIMVAQHETVDLKRKIPIEYDIDDSSIRVLNLIAGTANLSNAWAGINNKF